MKKAGDGDLIATTERTAIAGIVGGTVSVIGGGKFANGAYTAAFQHLMNEEAKGIGKLILSKMLDKAGAVIRGDNYKVDISFHSKSINENPKSWPNRTWDSNEVLTAMAHGSNEDGGYIIDQRSDASGDEVNGRRKIHAKELANILKDQPSFKNAKAIVLYSCWTGAPAKSWKGAEVPYAKQLAQLTGKTVIAPNGPWVGSTGHVYTDSTHKKLSEFISFDPN